MPDNTLRSKLFTIIEAAIFNHDDKHYLDKALDDLQDAVNEARINEIKWVNNERLKLFYSPKNSFEDNQRLTKKLDSRLSELKKGEADAS